MNKKSLIVVLPIKLRVIILIAELRTLIWQRRSLVEIRDNHAHKKEYCFNVITKTAELRIIILIAELRIL